MQKSRSCDSIRRPLGQGVPLLFHRGLSLNSLIPCLVKGRRKKRKEGKKKRKRGRNEEGDRTKVPSKFHLRNFFDITDFV